jgi:hypothetical protein
MRCTFYFHVVLCSSAPIHLQMVAVTTTAWPTVSAHEHAVYYTEPAPLAAALSRYSAATQHVCVRAALTPRRLGARAACTRSRPAPPTRFTHHLHSDSPLTPTAFSALRAGHFDPAEGRDPAQLLDDGRGGGAGGGRCRPLLLPAQGLAAAAGVQGMPLAPSCPAPAPLGALLQSPPIRCPRAPRPAATLTTWTRLLACCSVAVPNVES